MSRHHTPRKETAFDYRWRPTIAWVYSIVCIFDFFVAPIAWSMFQASYHGAITLQWHPITLEGAGLFHISMGAILGVTSWGRSQEKIGYMQVNTDFNQVNNIQPPTFTSQPANGPFQSFPPR